MKYEDTVCVAGVVLSPGLPRWVRLYPIPFRHVEGEKQFKKYAVIRVKVGGPTSDQRRESLRVDVDSIRIQADQIPMGKRHDLVMLAGETTACALNRGTRANRNATSLGLVKPYKLRIEIESSEGWTEHQAEVIRRWAEQPTLDLEGFGRVNVPPLVAPPLRVHYIYNCGEDNCSGHRQGVLDWELTALQRRAWRSRADPAVWVRTKFFEEMFNEERESWLVLGNQADPKSEGPSRCSASTG